MRGVDEMLTTIQKWGNSQAIRLPKAILETASIQENEQVQILAEQGKIIIVKPSCCPDYWTHCMR